MKLVFYNNWHNGDVHSTREFIKDIIKKTNFDEYIYLHNNSHKLLKDIENLKFNNTDKYCLDNNIILQINDTIYVNVWIGIAYYIEDIGVPTIKSYYTLFTYIYKKLNINLEILDYYVPEIDYEKYDIDEIKFFLNSSNKRKILIDNANFKSYQSNNFNFIYIIDKLVNEFKDIDFILTNSENKIITDNVFYTSDIIKTQYGDLNEISYISTFCNIIIGRSSGPYNFSVVKKNINDYNKTYICICNEFHHAFWFISVKSNCDKVWINQYDENLIYNIIKEKIQKL